MRKIYIAVISTVTVICVIFGIVWHFGDENFFGESEYSEYSISGSDAENAFPDFDSISAQIDTINLTIASGNVFTVKYKASIGEEPKINVENGTLVINQKHNKRTAWFGFTEKGDSLEITLPTEKTLKSIETVIAVGDIAINGIQAQNLDLESDVGDIYLEKCAFANTSIVDIVGDVDISNCELGDTSGESDVGDIDIKNCTFKNIELEASTGDVSVFVSHNLDGYSFDLNTDFGDIEVNEDESGNVYRRSDGNEFKIVITTDMGDIDLKYGEHKDNR